jgi:hypothetical protein
MSYPNLTPSSTNSAIILPSTGSHSEVASSLAIGYYTGSAAFVTGAASQVDFTYKRLGGDILDIELKATNVYNHYEEAVLEYSYIINLHQARNSLGQALGGPTGSFNNKGELTAGSDAALKYPRFKFDYAYRVSDSFSTEAGIGGTQDIYSASFDRVVDQQDYDLQYVISSSANSDNGLPYAPDFKNKRIKIRQVYYVTPRQMWRFYGYYGGLNVVGDFSNYGQYADDSSFQVIPVFQNKVQAIQYEDHLYTRTSHYSFEIINNKLRIYPVPDGVSPEKFWFRFSVEEDAFSSGSSDVGMLGVNNMNTLPFENIPFESINSMGQQWIRKYSLALSKETLGQVRGKFGGSIPIPGDNVTLNADALLSQAATEQQALKEELNKQLDEMLYSKLAETEKNMTDNTDAIVKKVPMKIFVG